MADKIDVHHHTVPDFYRQIGLDAGYGDDTVPEWDTADSVRRMEKLRIGFTILSIGGPGAEFASSQTANRDLARQINDFNHNICTSQPTLFGQFGALPSLIDTEGTIAEINYTLDELECEGVCLYTSYNGKYLGHKDFEPIWAELDRRHAVIFVHPIADSVNYALASPLLPPPLIDFPHETTRTAADLIRTGRKRQYPNCKVILSHAGGNLPYMASRLMALGTYLYGNLIPPGAPRGEEIIHDAKSFYVDTALAGTPNILDTLLNWAHPERILYGSDTPYTTTEAEINNASLDEYPMEEKLRHDIYRKNALNLFPRLGAKLEK